MKLRPAKVDDLPVLARWYKDLRTDERMDNVMTDDEIRSQMESFLLGNTYKTYFLEVGGNVVGYGMLDVTRKPMYLRHLFIDRAHRKKGHGKALIRMLMATHGISEVDIEVMVWNEDALRFYEKLGFKARYFGMRLK
jgi:ribosomal protein S18 acetylase RimI-like enzyme